MILMRSTHSLIERIKRKCEIQFLNTQLRVNLLKVYIELIVSGLSILSRDSQVDVGKIYV